MFWEDWKVKQNQNGFNSFSIFPISSSTNDCNHYLRSFSYSRTIIIFILIFSTVVSARNNDSSISISSILIKTNEQLVNSLNLELLNLVESNRLERKPSTIATTNFNHIQFRDHFGTSKKLSTFRKDPSLGTLRKHSQSLTYNRPRFSTFSSTMKFQTDNSCRSNCSGHGDCYNGTCLCEVEYSGGTCDHPNFKYYISFSTVYYMICVVSFIQLMLCINSEIARQKPRSITKAFRINIQKALYFFICIATAIRGFYFSSPANGQLAWTESLMNAYYPILMSGSSLLVCFWAEVFHLDANLERSRFLSKSFFGFILFNAITYSLYLAEFVLLSFTNPNDTDKGFFLSIFNSIYAFLMLVVVVFFLIYGVEVYFKVRGAFAIEESCSADISQLQQSRLGLISQAVLLLVTIIFMLSEVFGFLWKDKVPVLSRNYHQVMFRVVEFGVALWFPCVLWNCIQPEQLWILNPRRILKRQESQLVDEPMKAQPLGKSVAESEFLVGGRFDISKPSAIPECWICYETALSKPEEGPMIQPCACRGDVSAVHHSCLLRWLMESCSTSAAPVSCKVCGSAYKVEQSNETVWLPAGLTIAHWLKTATIFTIMCCTLTGSIMIVKLFQHMYVKMISVGSAILVEYICLRFLGFNMISAYHRAKISAIKIIGRRINISHQNININNNNSLNNLNINNSSMEEHETENTTRDQVIQPSLFDYHSNNKQLSELELADINNSQQFGQSIPKMNDIASLSKTIKSDNEDQSVQQSIVFCGLANLSRT